SIATRVDRSERSNKSLHRTLAHDGPTFAPVEAVGFSNRSTSTSTCVAKSSSCANVHRARPDRFVPTIEQKRRHDAPRRTTGNAAFPPRHAPSRTLPSSTPRCATPPPTAATCTAPKRKPTVSSSLLLPIDNNSQQNTYRATSPANESSTRC